MDHVLLEQVDHPRHLRVDEDPVTLGLEPRQKGIQNVELSRVAHQGLLV